MSKYILIPFLSIIYFFQIAFAGDKDALVIIDMQPYFVERGGQQNSVPNAKKVKDIINTQIKAIELAKKSHIPIIFLEYDGAGSTNEDLIKATKGYSDVKIIKKDTDGMFEDGNSYRAELVKYLAEKEIGNLIITGANGGACVHRSIEGSLDKNYNVTALNTAIADFNYKEFIYPYKNQYHFTLNCKNCKFKEVDGIEVVALDLATNKGNPKKKTGLEIDDTSRGKIKGKSTPSKHDEHTTTESTSK